MDYFHEPARQRFSLGVLGGLLIGTLTACHRTAEHPGAGLDATPGTLAGPATTPTLSRPRVGCVAALSGPVAHLGRAVAAGLRGGFATGEAGPGTETTCELVVVDDGYDSQRTRVAVAQLADDPRMLGLIACVGTPTAIAGMPVAQARDLVWFAGMSGAAALRDESCSDTTINVRSSYADEVRGLARGLVLDIGLHGAEIAFFTQRDGFGDDGFQAGLEVLHELDGTSPGDVTHARYELQIGVGGDAVATLLLARPRPRAVIMIAHSTAATELVRLTRAEGFETLFCGISFTDSAAVIEQLGALAEGMVFSEVVHSPDADTPWAADFRSRVAPEYAADRAAFEAYAAARLWRRALAAGWDDRASFQIHLAEVTAAARAQHLAGLGAVWPTRVVGGRQIELDWQTLQEQLR